MGRSRSPTAQHDQKASHKPVRYDSLTSPDALELKLSRTKAALSSLINRTISNYTIIKKLGQGGMGEVYLAEDSRLNRKVALKVLDPDFTRDKARLRRFEREARAASSLNHPNILTIHDVGSDGEIRFIATEYVEGQTLRQHLSQTRMNVREVLETAIQIAGALTAAHHAGIVHRDLKPENIMLRADGLVKVVDFGLAKLPEKASGILDSQAATLARTETEPGIILGTLGYMSPEQVRCQGVDARSDLFSLGIVLYEMLTSHRPFTGETPADVIAAILDSEPAPIARRSGKLPEAIESITQKLLRKDREKRYQTAKDLLGDLRGLKHRLEVGAELETSPSRAPRINSRLEGREGSVASLAILPLLNTGNDPSTEYLSDGITEILINTFSQFPDLRVIARTTAFRYKGSDVDPQKIGRELNVQAVLTGRVSQQADMLVVQADLIDVVEGTQMWGQRYRRKLSDIFAVQDRLARAIADKLRLRLTGEEHKLLAKRYTDNRTAYHLYLKGRYHWNKFAEEELRKAIDYFNQAVEEDPCYALAYCGLADAYCVLGVNYQPPKDTFPKAKAAALRALEIDDALAEAHVSVGAEKIFLEWDWPGAEIELKRALELKPRYAALYELYAYFLQATGRADAAIARLVQAQELDPLSPLIASDLGWAYIFARQHDEALEQGLKALELDRNFPVAHQVVGMAYLQKGLHKKALTALLKASALSGGSPRVLARLGYGYAKAGSIAKAQGVLDKLKSVSKGKYLDPFNIAVVLTGLGNDEEAFRSLEQAHEERSGQLIWLEVDPAFDNLRLDARFADLLRRMGLEPGRNSNQ